MTMNDIEEISKEIFAIFQNNGWTWYHGPNSAKDIEKSILSLINHLKEARDDFPEERIDTISTGRIGIRVYESGDIEIFIDGNWYIDKKYLMVELI